MWHSYLTKERAKTRTNLPPKIPRHARRNRSFLSSKQWPKWTSSYKRRSKRMWTTDKQPSKWRTLWHPRLVIGITWICRRPHLAVSIRMTLDLWPQITAMTLTSFGHWRIHHVIATSNPGGKSIVWWTDLWRCPSTFFRCSLSSSNQKISQKTGFWPLPNPPMKMMSSSKCQISDRCLPYPNPRRLVQAWRNTERTSTRSSTTIRDQSASPTRIGRESLSSSTSSIEKTWRPYSPTIGRFKSWTT